MKQFTSTITASTLKRETNNKEEAFKDLGFGTKITDVRTRLLNPNGTFNVRRTGLPFFRAIDLYHSLISMSTIRFIGVIFLSFFIINCFFAFIYMVVGMDQLQGASGGSVAKQFWEAFFFSAQTFTTVGYGGLSPVGFGASMISAIESMMGWLAFALATGLVYGRFSRPKARLLFSRYAIIAPYRDIVAFEFRIANLRANQLIEVEVQVVMTRVELTPDGGKIRKYYELELERRRVNFLSLSWTIVHPITDSSPMMGWNEEDLKQTDTEFLILIKGYDDTFNQTVYSRSSYWSSQIIWGAKFNSMYDNEEQGITTLRLDKMDDIERVNLPELSIAKPDKAPKAGV
jgi:inward rectifier potassium channel